MNFTRRLGNRSSQAKERPYRCESGKSQHTASSEHLEFRTHDKVWREHPGQIMEGAGDRATGQRGASGKMRWWEAVMNEQDSWESPRGEVRTRMHTRCMAARGQHLGGGGLLGADTQTLLATGALTTAGAPPLTPSPGTSDMPGTVRG